MDLTGIENEAEFFPAGTLSDVLETELGDITGRWKGLDALTHPVTRLKGHADELLTLLTQLRNTRDTARRYELHKRIGKLALKALGYDCRPTFESSALENAEFFPLLAKIHDADGLPAMWIVEAAPSPVGEEETDPLGGVFEEVQFARPDGDNYWENAPQSRALEEIVGDGIFKLSEAPRFVLIVGSSQLVLIDSRKWAARSVLRFDLQEICSRQDAQTFQVMACLISKEARVPAEGAPSFVVPDA